MIKLQHILIASFAWATLSSVLLYRKTLFRKKVSFVDTVKKESSSKDIINYPKSFTISLVFNSNESPDSLLISDWVVKYSDLVNNNYSLPNINSKEENTKVKESSQAQELTPEDMDELDIPEISKGIFESLNEKDYPGINESNVPDKIEDNNGTQNYETVSNINSEF